MLNSLNTLLGAAVMERATLLANHVVGSEPAATQRLQKHVGRSIQLQFSGWPPLLPPLPNAAFVVTPAGLLEWQGQGLDAGADLQVSFDASNPALAVAQAVAGERPQVEVAGDAAFAADLNWLFDNLRWDVQDDLERLVGPAPAREIARLGGAVAQAMRLAAKAVVKVAQRAGDAPAR